MRHRKLGELQPVDPPSVEATAAAGLDEADEAGDAAGVGRESSGTSAERDKENSR